MKREEMRRNLNKRDEMVLNGKKREETGRNGNKWEEEGRNVKNGRNNKNREEHHQQRWCKILWTGVILYL